MDKQDHVGVEQPQNGRAGLKHWRYDLVAGLMVSLVSLPFSLGIAVASGAPPVAGLISAIIAGLIYPFLGGSYVTISGPAAGLAPALLAAMTTLGAGNLQVGYPLLLGVICLTGCVQIVLSALKAARFSALFPSSVVEGMLAAIGLLIIAKELPLFLGQHFESHEFFGILLEIPAAVGRMNWTAFLVGALCLALLAYLGATRFRRLRAVPPPLTVVLVGIGLGLVLGLDPRYRIHVPGNVLEHGLVLPHFAELLANSTLWWTVITVVVTLTLIDGVESLATIAAIDKIDPFKRKSSPNRTLLAMGISNICSSLAGGLTIIPGGVKSTVCIVTGGRTLWANFWNAMFLLLFLLCAASLINLIPLPALAAVVMYIGYKLCAPHVWKHIAHIGPEQLFVFTVTVLTTLLTDLLIGIFAGMIAKMLVSTTLSWSSGSESAQPGGAVGQALRCMGRLFRDPLTGSELAADGTYHLYFDGPLVCFNLLHVRRALTAVPAEAERVSLHFAAGVSLIDHTTYTNLLDFVRGRRQGLEDRVEFLGLERFEGRSHHEACMRVSTAAAAMPAAVVVANGVAVHANGAAAHANGAAAHANGATAHTNGIGVQTNGVAVQTKGVAVRTNGVTARANGVAARANGVGALGSLARDGALATNWWDKPRKGNLSRGNDLALFSLSSSGGEDHEPQEDVVFACLTHNGEEHPFSPGDLGGLGLVSGGASEE